MEQHDVYSFKIILSISADFVFRFNRCGSNKRNINLVLPFKVHIIVSQHSLVDKMCNTL